MDKTGMRYSITLAAAAVAMASTGSVAGEWRGNVDLELRGFVDDPLDSRQMSSNASVSVEPEFIHSWNDGDDLFTFKPFARLDAEDDERTHIDIRDLSWEHAADDWELRVGIRKVFWGVTESTHLVDIINQTDLVENTDGEDKLGQPMVNYAMIRDWGTLDFFVLPGFRERTFAGEKGRPRPSLLIDNSLTTYESDDEDGHVDFAIRYSHTFGDFDLGLSHFHGTSRDPSFNPVPRADGMTVLAPHYAQIDRTGIDLQATKDSWLWKLEAIRQSSVAPSYWATTFGFEYTFFGVTDGGADLGVLAEYLYDSRRDRSPTPFEDDVLIGARLAMNDAQSTEMLVGVIVDLDGDAKSYSIEASRRLGDSFKLSLEARAFSGVAEGDPLYDFRNDDFVQLTLGWFF